MKLYRFVQAGFRNISGDRKAGRWHHSAVSVMTALGEPAMCLLESGIVTEINKIPKGYGIQELDVPDDSIFYVTALLPENWSVRPFRHTVQEFGTAILLKADHLIVAFPSAVMTRQFVYHINPLHPDWARVKESDFYELGVNEERSGV